MTSLSDDELKALLFRLTPYAKTVVVLSCCPDREGQAEDYSRKQILGSYKHLLKKMRQRAMRP